MASVLDMVKARGWSAALACAAVLAACEAEPTFVQTPAGTSRGPSGMATSTGTGGNSAGGVVSAGTGGASTSGSMETTAAAPALKDGARCESDDECGSGHCNNEICCESGDCCAVAEDCPASEDNTTAVCDEPETCQGSRGAAMCVKNRCRARDPIDDDSACDAEVKADDCGPYKPVLCDGKKEQKQPSCKASCNSDSDCYDDAHCADGECVADVPDGSECMAPDQCESGHCSQGVCCKEGDCCKTAMDCDAAKYTSAPMCADKAMCQGKRGEPSCEAGQCTIGLVDDDTACDNTVVANDCGDGPDVKCRGGEEQKAPPGCAGGTCSAWGGSTCGQDAFCYQGTCRPDQPNGERCPDSTACQSGHCENNICCDEGACCTDDSQCAPIRECTEPGKCQGKRTDRTCNVEKGVCEPKDPVDDDSACVGQVSDTACGLNFPILCSVAPNQPTTRPPTACPRCTRQPECPEGSMPGLLGGCRTYNAETMEWEASSVAPTYNNPKNFVGCRPVPGVECGATGTCAVP